MLDPDILNVPGEEVEVAVPVISTGVVVYLPSLSSVSAATTLITLKAVIVRTVKLWSFTSLLITSRKAMARGLKPLVESL